MNEIKCPKCGNVFQVDEASYADIVKQVRDKEFKAELEERERLLQREREQAVRTAKSELESRMLQERMERDSRIEQLEQKLEAKDDELSRALESERREADAVKAKEKAELAAKISELEGKLGRAADAAARETAEREAGYREELARRDREIAELKLRADADRKAADDARELAVERATSELKTKVVELEGKVDQAHAERDQVEAQKDKEMAEAIRSKELQLQDKEDEIERLRSQRSRLSAKLIGETLEQHCENEFNSWWPTAFRNAEFHKDNEVVGGSKGDYVFREKTEDGVEILSIMFEMKNEDDQSDAKNRHRNKDFFKKLDQDRRNKGCEYAVLVTTLEPDNELYNRGIVDVSYEYPKMYVIRPQFFIPMITLLRNSALNTVEARRELAQTLQQNIDVTNFEEELDKFKEAFGKNYDTAAKKFAAAIAEIDKTIDHLSKVKDNLISSERQLRLANDKADKLTIRKLTYRNETMKGKFEEARALRESAPALHAGADDAFDAADPVEPDSVE